LLKGSVGCLQSGLFLLLTACAAPVATVSPLAAALGSCSTVAQASHMVPEGLPAPEPAWLGGIARLNVIGPQTRSIPPPILAASFQQALQQTLRHAGLLAQSQDLPQTDRELRVEILSQHRQGNFKRTRLELTVSYSIVNPNSNGASLQGYTVRTNAEIDDWKIDACNRLRKLQERLSRENIEQAYRRIFLQQP